MRRPDWLPRDMRDIRWPHWIPYDRRKHVVLGTAAGLILVVALGFYLFGGSDAPLIPESTAQRAEEIAASVNAVTPPPAPDQPSPHAVNRRGAVSVK